MCGHMKMYHVISLKILVFIIVTKQAFSVMNIIKIKFYNKVEDEFVIDSLMFYIRKEIVVEFGTEQSKKTPDSIFIAG